MTIRAVALLAAFCLATSPGTAFQPAETHMHARSHAAAKVKVQKSRADVYDRMTGLALAVISIEEIFSGDIEGTSTVRALEVRRPDGPASMVSMQRVRGKLGGREGSFVLQGQETIEHGKIRATWTVVPGSGTGELSGLRGDGGFAGDFGKETHAVLDYWFEPADE
jgi:hypothetical protein